MANELQTMLSVVQAADINESKRYRRKLVKFSIWLNLPMTTLRTTLRPTLYASLYFSCCGVRPNCQEH
eukprot:15224-Heterococcus_DN1.PRE.2